MELSTTFEPGNIESKWYKQWLDIDAFSPKGNIPYTIILPPPNVTGKLHAGHALDVTIQDILARYKRMQGFSVNWIPGLDHAGIATQVVVEKLLFETEGKKRFDYTREEFLEKTWEWKEKHAHIILEQLEKLGATLNWPQLTFTMDSVSKDAVNYAFSKFYQEGLIFRDDYIVNWDTQLQSAISDLEVVFKKVKGAFYYVKYNIVGQTDYLTVATTRPETIFGDTAVAVNPNDARFNHLIGKKTIVPLANREVPIIGDEYVDMELGTGQLKVTPGHDFNDFLIGKRHNLPIINILNKDGSLNNNALEFNNLNAAKARPLVVERLKELDLLLDTKEYYHEVGHGERSGTILEPMVSRQWFLNIKDMATSSINAVKEQLTKFVPKTWENTFYSWLNEPKNWCISRQLWWGHQIPIFYCNKCNHTWNSTKATICPNCNSTDIYQDPDVLDTWFSSALWPLTLLGFPSKDRMQELDFSKRFPTSVLVTGYDIIFFWVARMMMFSLKFTNQVPFKDVYIHAIVRDEQGRKMSKSLGNGVDPIAMIEKYGADAFRLALSSGAGFGRNINLGENRINSYRFFLNKIWNAFRFLYPFLDKASSKLPNQLDSFEKWILHKLGDLIVNVNQHLDHYRFDEATAAIYTFIYEDYCSLFIEFSKNHLYRENPNINRIQVLKYVFLNIITLLHPFAPFITEELWSYFKESNEPLLINKSYPKNPDFNFRVAKEEIDLLAKILTNIRNLRAAINLSPKDTIDLILYSDNLSISQYVSDLKLLAGAKTIELKTLLDKRPNNSIVGVENNCEIFLLIDKDSTTVKEYKKRVEKELVKLQKELDAVSSKLENPNFMANAPKEIIAEITNKQTATKEKLLALKTRTSFLS